MPWTVTLITDQLDVKLRFNKLGYEIWFVIGVYFEARNSSLKSLAFSLKSVTNLLPIFSDCTRYTPFKKVFKIDQNVLELAVGSVNFWANWM